MARGGKNFIDLSGKEFGSLLVVERTESTSSGKFRWTCYCVCGKECTVPGAHLRSGHTTSCGHPPLLCAHGHLRSVENLYPDGTCKTCQGIRRAPAEYKTARNEESRTYYAKTSAEYRKKTRGRMATLKLEVLTHYSPDHILKCSCVDCVVMDIDMLSLDHVDNDGAEHRRSISTVYRNRGGEKMYRLVKNGKFPEGFQTLCMNHQLKKHLLNVRSKQT